MLNWAACSTTRLSAVSALRINMRRIERFYVAFPATAIRWLRSHGQ